MSVKPKKIIDKVVDTIAKPFRSVRKALVPELKIPDIDAAEAPGMSAAPARQELPTRQRDRVAATKRRRGVSPLRTGSMSSGLGIPPLDG